LRVLKIFFGDELVDRHDCDTSLWRSGVDCPDQRKGSC